jgi:hypothetical protein
MLAIALTLALTTHGVDTMTLVEPAVSLVSADKEPPKIVTLEPEDQSLELEAKKVTKLVVTFDRPMSTSTWSFCGGGPNFPKIKGTPYWDNPKRVVAIVELEPDHQYNLSLNCPAAGNFRSSDGVSLVPVPWSFRTLPDKLPDQAKQKTENRTGYEALQKTLADSYSYYDLRVKDWNKLLKAHEAAILGAKTTGGWTAHVAKMLAATEDIHLHLKYGDATFATGKRAIDSLFRSKLLAQYVQSRPLGERCIEGRTDDGIGYLMIASWENANDVAAIEQALPKLRECKAMVVDVRPNAGGDELLAQRVAAWFVEGTKVYAKDRFRVRAGKDGFGPVLDRSITGHAEADKRFDVPIAVLTSRYVMSSNESFVMMMKQAKDCTVVGQKTYGSSGCPKPHELPNGVTIVVPSWQDLRLDGTCFEGEGLKPDVEVPGEAKDFETKDPILESALALLRKKLNKTDGANR